MNTNSVKELIVCITSCVENNRSFGSGFVFHHENGRSYILTCAHVIFDIEAKDVCFVDGEIAQIELIGDPNYIDLAIISIPSSSKEHLYLLSQESIKYPIYLAGFSEFGNFKSLKELKCESYMITHLVNNNRRISAWLFYLPSVPESLIIEDGYSGSPLIRQDTNQVIGIVSHRQGSKRGLAVNINMLFQIWKDCPINLIMKYEEELQNSKHFQGFGKAKRQFTSHSESIDKPSIILENSTIIGDRSVVAKYVNGDINTGDNIETKE